MSLITVQLPIIHEPFAKPRWFDTAPVASLWFPDSGSKVICMKALGIWNVPDMLNVRRMLLQSGNYQLILNMSIGSSQLPPRNSPCIFYLSPRIFSGERYFARAFHATEADAYSFYLLSSTELELKEAESSVIADLYDDAKRIFHTTPFLARNTPEDFLALKQWLADIVFLINVKRIKEQSSRRLETVYSYTSTLLSLQPPRSGCIEQPEQLLSLLALRQHGSEVSTYMGQVEVVKDQSYKAFEPLPPALNESALKRIEETYQYVHNEPFTATLGNEVLPGLRKTRRALRYFAETLEQSPYEALQNIGREMSAALAEQIPILALTGTFSSGKTTLLNSLLVGQDNANIRAFRTKPGANTAIVSEITHVSKDKPEQRVEFGYRQKINNFSLATISPTDTNIATNYITEIQALLEKGVLTNTALRIMPINPRMDKKNAIELRTKEDIQKRLRYLLWLAQQNEDKKDDDEHSKDAKRTSYTQEEHDNAGIDTFSAEILTDALAREYLRPPDEQVNRDGIVQYRLPTEIDLTTDEGWEDFQGKPEGTATEKKGQRIKLKSEVKQHWTEVNIATLLIERSRVYLNHPLLELTTIADTPGTGSLNTGHDHVTKEYLQEASAYIVLLPTHIVSSGRANTGTQDNQDEANRILKQLVDVLKGDLSRVAFVVNCWANTDESSDVVGKIVKYEQILANAFHLTSAQWHTLRQRNQNFFVVQLKGVQGGDRPTTLYSYPSLVPLQSWIEKTFRSGKYLARYDRLKQFLGDEWQRNHGVWIQKLRSLQQEAKEREDMCNRLRQFIKDLHALTDKHLDDVRTFRQNFTSQGSRVSRMMQHRGSEPGSIRKPEELNPWRDALKQEYTAFNELLRDFASIQTLETWIREVKSKARSLPIMLPALVAEDPANQSYAWSPNRSFATYQVDDTFAKVAERWPDNLLKNITGFFTNIRTTLVKELQEFWRDQYSEIWSSGLETYLQRCETFLEKQQQAVQAATQQEIDKLERLNDPELRKRLEQEYREVIHAFEALEQERQELQNQLVRALTE